MLRKRFISLLVTLAVTLAVVGALEITADALGLLLTPHVYSCEAGGNAGGGC